ncbi:TlyA family RNA methyltransferase [Arthrobacter sp. Br18]|uniref:TlyA family RNA methyltransferase n=1 Tax=Arthrobacter sp. Br18 TaxID=1312954 RepID=UPI000478B1A2|nr:TlyA family RNA methyltransferase [Arthrobacter sp. Br18]
MTRLDQELVQRGLARSRSHAAQLINAGRVLHGGVVAGKAAVQVSADQTLQVEPTGEDYVSRAGSKLAGAFRTFPAVAPEGRRCLDAGASTGGFTEVLLALGARQVAAVDVGHGQLAGKLRGDPRVSVFEGMNVRHLEPEHIGGRVDLTVADLSFISLRLVIEALARSTRAGGHLLLLIKPQFEVGRSGLNGQGVVKSDTARRRGVHGVLRAAVQCGLVIGGIAPSEPAGQDGNREYFVWIKVPESPLVPRIEGELDLLADQALQASGVFAEAAGSPTSNGA